MSHPTNRCPVLQDEGVEHVNMTSHVPVPREEYQPYSSTYNPGWSDHPNLIYGGNRQQNFMPNRQHGYQQQYQSQPQAPSSNSSPSLENMMKELTANTMWFQQKMKSDMQNSKA